MIEKVLTNKKGKRKLSIDDNENSSELATTTTTNTATAVDSVINDENDMKWAANYIEEQQTKLILNLLTDDAEKPVNTVENDDHEEEDIKEDDYKSLRPSLETMGLGKFIKRLLLS